MYSNASNAEQRLAQGLFGMTAQRSINKKEKLAHVNTND